MKRNYSEKEVFAQLLSDEELQNISGGLCGVNGKACDSNADYNCFTLHYRMMYGGKGFANCASTVEDGSWCSSNDACFADEVNYQGMQSCTKAWR